MSRYQPHSQEHDSGTARARATRRPFKPRSLANAVAAPVMRRVQKRYGSRLPVSGQEPARVDAYERRRKETRS